MTRGGYQLKGSRKEWHIFKRLITWRIPGWAEIPARLTGLRFQPGLPTKYLRNGAGNYLKKVSARFELPELKISASWPGWKIPCNRKKFQPGLKRSLTSMRKYKLPKQQRLPKRSWLSSHPISFSARAETFHVIGIFFNPVCRAEIFPCDQPLRQKHSLVPFSEIELCIIWTGGKIAKWINKTFKNVKVAILLHSFPKNKLNLAVILPS